MSSHSNSEPLSGFPLYTSPYSKRSKPFDALDVPSDESDDETHLKRRRVRAASRFRDNLGKRSSNSTLRRINSTPVGSTAMMSARTNVTNNDLTALLSPARGGTRRPPSFTNLCLENGQEVPMFVASGTEVHSLNAQDAKRGSMAIRPQAASNVTPRSRLSTMKEKGSPRMKRRKIYTGTSTGWNYFEIGVDASTEAGSSLFSVWNWKPFWNPLTEIKNVSPFMELSKKIVELMNRVASFYEFHAQPKIRLFIVDEAKFNEDTLHITAERFGAEEFEEEESITNRTIGSLQPASGKLLSTLIQKSDMIAQLSCNAERTCYPPIVHLTSRDLGAKSFQHLYGAVEGKFNITEFRDVPDFADPSRTYSIINIETCSSNSTPLPIANELPCANAPASPNRVPEFGEGSQQPQPMALFDLNERRSPIEEVLSTRVDLDQISHPSQNRRETVDLLSGSTSAGSSSKCSGNDFDLQKFMESGVFIPGPSRPRVQQPSSNNVYIYETLQELARKLDASVGEDIDKASPLRMMVASTCYTYGIVETVMNRHDNAYFVRIYDETMPYSILVRIHTGSHEQNKGPVIKVGHILRVHRATVQMEWDSGRGEHAMVLSTSSHRNFVLFEQSDDQYTFHFNTCAASISLRDCDRLRVAELQHFKMHRLAHPNEEIDEGAAVLNNIDYARSLLTQQQRKSLPKSLCSNQSDGINTPDIRTPTSSHRGSDDWNLHVHAQTLIQTNRDSNDSFLSAQSQLVAAIAENVQQLEPNNECADIQADQPIVLFRDLKRTEETFAILCHIVSLGAGKNSWEVLIRDIEQTLPKVQFRSELNPLHNDGRECLVLSISDGRQLLERSIVKELWEMQGTDELFRLENIRVVGTCPPFQLQADGSTFEIQRDHNYMDQMLEGSFSTTASVRVINHEIAGGSTAATVDEHPVSDITSCTDVSRQRQNCHDGTSKLPDDTCDSRIERQEWTGKPKGRRKPREHYQPEEAFDC